MPKEEIEKLKIENEKLKKMNSVKSDLISISAHQLRTSLSALKWILMMFIEKDLGSITSEQETFIKRAMESSNRMILLVNDLLTLSRMDDQNIKFNMEKINIIKLIEETIFEFSGETLNKNIDLIFLKPETSDTWINGDEKMIRVVIQNLIENSIKYNDKDDKIFISLNYKEGSSSILFSIRDTGIGIDEKDQSNIFNKFFRAPNATKKDPIGSGLGLFTTKNIVERHNGKIWFESKIGVGTTFFISLPII